MSNFKGVFPVVVTPFKENGDIDFEALSFHANWLVEKGAHGLIPVGTTGEYAAQTFDEQKKVAKVVIDVVNGRVPVIVGTTAETANRVIDLSLTAKKNGADGVMVLPSPYNKPTQDEIYAHFKLIAEEIDMPIMVYNNPWSTGVDIKAETIIKLAELKNIDYVKECTGDIKRQREIILGTDSKIKIFSGWDDMCYEAILLGAVGWVSMVANVFPELCVEMVDLLFAKESDKAWDIYLKLLPFLSHLEYAGVIQQSLKYAGTKRGLNLGVCRQPKLPLTDAQKAAVNKAISGLI